MIFRSFKYGEYYFKNYIDCSHQEHLEILKNRNDVNIRKWMTNNLPISEDSHFSFIKKLRFSSDKIYYAVFKNQKYVASIYLTDIDGFQGERGLYVVPDFQGKGLTQFIEAGFVKLVSDHGIRKIIARVKSNNLRSISYHLRTGYKEVARDCEYIHYTYDINEI